MKNMPNVNMIPYTVCFAVSVLAIVFPAIFFREATAWAILFGLAPFGLLQLVGLWLVLDGITRAKSTQK